MNEHLRELYSNWKRKLDGNAAVVTDLSPPGLVFAPASYEKSARRVLVIGQEDMGNQWSQEILDSADYDYVGSSWKFNPILTWADFLKNKDSVDALMAGYRLFAFARHQPKNFRSPFWTAFRRFAGDDGAGCLTNLDRTSYDAGAIDDGPPGARRYLNENGHDELLRKEIEILDPQICIFFTGPSRDYLVDQKWAVERVAMSSDIPVEQLCRISAEGLPRLTFRTYHPGHLSRCNKGFYLDTIERYLVAAR